MSGWATFFWIIVTFSLLYPLNRWISIHLQGVAFLMTGSRQAATAVATVASGLVLVVLTLVRMLQG